MDKGYIYIWIDPSQGEDILKIGKSTTKPKRKEEKQGSDGLSYIAFDAEVTDCSKAETLIHNKLKKYALVNKKDLFRISLDKAVAEIRDVSEQLEKIDSYKKALSLEPDNASFYNNLGCSYDKLGNHAEAIEAYKHAIQLSPRNAVFHNNLGCNYGKLRLYRKAIDAFKDSVRLDPKFVKSYFDLGFSYSQIGAYKEAIEAFKEAIRINPDIAQIHYNLAHTYSKAGSDRESIGAFEKALDINPNYSAARFALAIKYLKIGNKDEAMEQYRFLKQADTVKARQLLAMIDRK